MKKLLLIAIVAMATSCGVTNRLTFNANQIQTQVQLSEANFDVVKTVEGKTREVRIFGIGGWNTENATAEMTKNANLKGSQAIVNVTTQIQKKGIIPFFWITKTTSSGQVIEFK